CGRAGGLRAGAPRSRLPGEPENAVRRLGAPGAEPGKSSDHHRLRTARTVQPVTDAEVLRKLEAVAGRDVGIREEGGAGKRVGRCTEARVRAPGAGKSGRTEIKTGDEARVQAHADGGPAAIRHAFETRCDVPRTDQRVRRDLPVWRYGQRPGIQGAALSAGMS